MNMMPITLLEYPPVVSVNKMVKERGWTEAMVRRHLGPPDALAVNPVAHANHPMKVYLVRRVERAERRAEVIADLERVAEDRRIRDMVDDGSMNRLRDRLEADLASVSIDITPLPFEQLRRAAYASVNLARAQKDEGPVDYPERDLRSASIIRYARMNLVDYQPIHDAFEHRAKPREVEFLLRGRIDAMVIAAYPELAAKVEQ